MAAFASNCNSITLSSSHSSSSRCKLYASASVPPSPLRSLLQPLRSKICASIHPWPLRQSSYGEERKLLLSATAIFRVMAGGAEAATEQATTTTALKEFLEELKSVGRIRIIVNTGVGVLESVTTLEKLFYHTMAGRGEYANLMNKEENVDFHLLLDKVTTAKFVKGKSMRGDIPTYAVRFIDVEDKTAATLLLMWKPDTNGEYDPGQVESFELLLEKYGEVVSFKQ